MKTNESINKQHPETLVEKRPPWRTLLSWRRIRSFIRAALMQNESPRKLSLSFAVGAFCGVLPIPGHTPIAIGLAYIFRLNIAAAIAGAWITPPPVIPFAYALAFVFGAFITRQALPDITMAHLTDASVMWEQIGDFMVPFVVGTTALGIVLAVGSYFAGLHVIRTHREWQTSIEVKPEEDVDVESRTEGPLVS